MDCYLFPTWAHHLVWTLRQFMGVEQAGLPAYVDPQMAGINVPAVDMGTPQGWRWGRIRSSWGRAREIRRGFFLGKTVSPFKSEKSFSLT